MKITQNGAYATTAEIYPSVVPTSEEGEHIYEELSLEDDDDYVIP